jgi:hypothetical protein
MRAKFLGAAVILALPLSPGASAAAFDGAQPMVCATLEVLECEPGIKCEAETVDNLDAPQFLQVSVQDQKIIGTRPSGTPLEAKIELVRHVTPQMLLQGVEKMLAWSMAINETTGKMSLTINDDATIYVIFGACTLR